MKCYLMYHIHVFEDETKDYKIIGVFTSYDKALDVKGKYSSELVGFKDYPSGFCIEEFEVVGLDVAKQRTVYVIFTYIYKDGEEEELSVIKIVRNFEYEEHNLNEKCWQEGFITYDCKYEGNI